MKRRSQLEFPESGSGLVRRPVLITGVMRSGTSVLAQLIGTMQGVELFYEPWTFMMIPVFHDQGAIETKAAGMNLRKFCEETMLHSLMGRNLNSRPGDFSAYPNYLAAAEVKRRWRNVRSREDVRRRLKSNPRTLVIKSSNLQPYYEFLFASLPDLRIIHIQRHPGDVAASTQRKGWYSESGLSRPESMPVRILNKSRAPYFLDDTEAERFIRYGNFERGLLAWTSLMNKHIALKKKLRLGRSQMLELSYEELTGDPAGTLKDLEHFLRLKRSPRSVKFLRKIKRKPGAAKISAERLIPADRNKFHRLMHEAGYCCG